MLLTRKHKRGGGGEHSTDGAPRKGQPGRPLKHSKDLAAPRSVIREERKKLHQKSKVQGEAYNRGPEHQPTLSAFERLPNEILQHIFFDSLNTNLALTSRTLNQALSSESVFKSLILLAFFASEACRSDDYVEKNLFLPAQYRHLDNGERLNLQSAILGFRWCSLTRIRNCMPALSRLAILGAFRGDHSLLSKTLLTQPPNEREDVVVLPDADDYEALNDHYSALKTSSLYEARRNARERPLADQTGPDGTLPFIRVPPLYYLTGQSWKYMSEPRPVLGAMTIPDKVLRGAPWTDEKLCLLQLLRQGLRYRDWPLKDQPLAVSADAMFDGMASAIKEQHRSALLCLLNLFAALREEPAWDTTGRFNPDDYKITLSERVAARHDDEDPSLPLRLFYLAAGLGESSAEYLALLIRTDVNRIPKDDEILTAWALREDGDRSNVATWLLHYMETPQARNSDFEDGAYTREGAVPTPAEIFTSVSFADEIGFVNERTLRLFALVF